MTQSKVTLPSGKYLLVEVPAKSVGFQITRIVGISGLHYGVAATPLTIDIFSQTLPPGNWTLLGADPTRLTDDEAGEIVEKFSYDGDIVGYKDYEKPTWIYELPTASLDSLAASLGIEKPFVILKNK